MTSPHDAMASELRRVREERDELRKAHAELVDWLSTVDFSDYSTAALQAAYDALVDDGSDPPESSGSHAEMAAILQGDT